MASKKSLTLDELDHSEDTERLWIREVAKLVGHNPSQTDGISLIPSDPLNKTLPFRGAGANDDSAVRNAARRSRYRARGIDSCWGTWHEREPSPAPSN